MYNSQCYADCQLHILPFIKKFSLEMTPDRRAETCSWDIWSKIHFNNYQIESCVRLYFTFIYLYYYWKALCYKQAGRGFDSRWCHWNFSV